MQAAVNPKGRAMRFDIEVHWNPDGLLEGKVRSVGEAAATQFWGIAELVGLLQAQLGPVQSRVHPAIGEADVIEPLVVSCHPGSHPGA
jgi:hypothetical protein